jgi:hypothetical protein
MATNFEEQREFAKWVLNVGNSNLPAIAKEESVDPDWIKIPSHMRLPAEDCSLRGLIRTSYPDHRCHSGGAMYLMQRSILAPKNTDVDEVNNAILESLSEESHTYLSVNSLTPTEEGASVAAGVSMDSLYPVEFLNILQFSGIANHKLELKVGVPILLLCNLNQSIELCNGMRLIVKRLGQRVIEAEIIIGNNVGKRVFIPRIIMSPPGLIGHLFCVVVNFQFEWHLRSQSTRVKVRHSTMLGYICHLRSIPMASYMLLFHGSQVVQTSRFSTVRVPIDTCEMSYIKWF